jgi:hypothetical protein
MEFRIQTDCINADGFDDLSSLASYSHASAVRTVEDPG